MRELLNHSAGYGYGLSGNDPVNAKFRDTGVLASTDLDDLIAKVADIPLLFEPGERWSYSISVDIQGYIVQRLSGQRFGDFLEQEIFKPLAMNDTRFFVKAEDVGRFAEVHNWDSERSRLVQRPHRSDRPSYLDSERLESGGGGLVSSTHDYARFLQLLVNEGELDGTRLLTPESIRIMRTNSLRDGLNLRGSLTSQGQAGQGFGVDFAVIIDPEKANSPNSPARHGLGCGGINAITNADLKRRCPRFSRFGMADNLARQTARPHRMRHRRGDQPQPDQRDTVVDRRAHACALN